MGRSSSKRVAQQACLRLAAQDPSVVAVVVLVMVARDWAAYRLGMVLWCELCGMIWSSLLRSRTFIDSCLTSTRPWRQQRLVNRRDLRTECRDSIPSCIVGGAPSGRFDDVVLAAVVATLLAEHVTGQCLISWRFSSRDCIFILPLALLYFGLVGPFTCVRGPPNNIGRCD